MSRQRRWFRNKWTRRVGIAGTFVLVLALLGVFWIRSVGRDLVCREDLSPSDAILVENFEPNYLVFERTAELRKAGLSSRVFVPTDPSDDPERPNLVSAGIIEVMVRVARLPNPEIIPIRQVEPISLNAAYQIRTALQEKHIRSVIVVAPGLRSRRSMLIYSAVLGEVGISTSCVPVFGQHTPDTWTRTWHGIQQVLEQYVKLQYYRFYVLPRRT